MSVLCDAYARVSTHEQNLDLQKDALKRTGCKKNIEDVVSGKAQTRSGLDRAREMLREGDVLVVWRLDRLGRSLKHLIELMAELEKQKIGFQSLQESIDTTTPGGKLCVPYLRGTGTVRAQSHPGANQCRAQSGQGEGAKWRKAQEA